MWCLAHTRSASRASTTRSPSHWNSAQTVLPSPQYPPQQIIGRGRSWSTGRTPAHGFSDGHRAPEEVAAVARAAHLNFMISTDHNTSASQGVWGPLAGEDLLIIPGEEVTTRNGHYLALGVPPGDWIDWRYLARDKHFGEAAHTIHESGALLVLAHPYCAYVACRWKFGYDEAVAVEVWNGPWIADDESAVDTWDGHARSGHQRRGRPPMAPCHG
jgi:hypothetical protein